MKDVLRTTGLVLSDRQHMEPWAARVLQVAVDAVTETLAQLAARMGVGESRLSALKDPQNAATIALSKIPSLPDASREVIARAILGDRYAVVRLPDVHENISDAELHKETADVVTCALTRGVDFDREADEAIVAILRRKIANAADRLPANVAAIRRSR